MADTIKIGNLDISAFKVGSSDCKIYIGDTLLYPHSTPPTPVSSCYEVIPQPISQYASTTYDSVYSWSDSKWYMKNNLRQYEEYGVYDIVENISSATTYDGKLAVVGTTEYQYSGGSWVVVGTYEDASVTYTIDNTNTSQYVGQELATTFKIPVSDVEALGGKFDFRIRTADGGRLEIRATSYRYIGGSTKIGTVTNDGEYYYYELPDIDSVVIKEIQYRYKTPIHLIVGSKQVSVEYAEKEIPTAKVYNTVEDMEYVGCPTVGINQYGVVGDNVYKFEESEEWVNKAKSSLKFVAKYNDGNANVIECNTSNELSSGDIQPSYLSKNAMTDAYIGDCVTSIGNYAFNNCTSLSSITIPNSVIRIGESAFSNCTSLPIENSIRYADTYAIGITDNLTTYTLKNNTRFIGNGAFYYCLNLTSINIPESVIYIGNEAFYSCTNLTSIDIPSGVTSIGDNAFNGCRSLTSVTVNAATPPTIGTEVFVNTNNCPIYVPSQSVSSYKSATNWSTYASRIQAIPT